MASENIESSPGRGLAGTDDELLTEAGVAKRMLVGRLTGSEYMVTSITVPSEAAESVDCKTYVSIKNCYIFNSNNVCEKSEKSKTHATRDWKRVTTHAIRFCFYASYLNFN